MNMTPSRKGLGLLLALTATLFVPAAHADSIWGEFDALDTESVPSSGVSEDPFAGRVRFGYIAASGNTESTNLNGKVELGLDQTDWRHAFVASSIYSKNEFETTAENYRAGYKADRKLGGKNYLFGSLSWEQDEFSGYNMRTAEAVGYGRRFLDTEIHVLDLEFGVGARQTELVDGDEQHETISRLAGNYLWKFGDNSDFSQQIVVESGSLNTYIESISALTSQLVGKLDLVISYTMKRNSSVQPGLEELDTYTTVSVQYSF